MGPKAEARSPWNVGDLGHTRPLPPEAPPAALLRGGSRTWRRWTTVSDRLVLQVVDLAQPAVVACSLRT